MEECAYVLGHQDCPAGLLLDDLNVRFWRLADIPKGAALRLLSGGKQTFRMGYKKHPSSFEPGCQSSLVTGVRNHRELTLQVSI